MKRSRPLSSSNTTTATLESSCHSIEADVQEVDHDQQSLRSSKIGDSDPIQDKCWKCLGHGRTRNPSNRKLFTGKICPVCQGTGQRPASKRSQQLAEQPGRIVPLRGRNGYFAGQRAVQGWRSMKESPESIVNQGEILGALGCGDWRIFQLANGHKLTVDDFVCAWVAAEEMDKQGFGLVQAGPFGQVPTMTTTTTSSSSSISTTAEEDSSKLLYHADLGCGCGSVLMMMAWAFPKIIRSHGVEAQHVSYDLCRRGLEWNLGQDGSQPDHTVQLSNTDLRHWDGDIRSPYHVVTGTPPYFPADRFASSPNHVQKLRCRIPTRGAAADYVAAAARLVRQDGTGIICIAETARSEGEQGMRQAIQEHKLRVKRRLDVITRTGLPPRFSIWVLTPLISQNEESSTRTTVGVGATTAEVNDHHQQQPESASSSATVTGKNPSIDFPIKTLTIRNQDQSRTVEYVNAMTRMGWVDFEQTLEKTRGQI